MDKIEFHPNPKQLWEEYHSVIAPVIVLEGYDYERKYDEEPSHCKHPESLANYYDSLSEGK